MGKGALGRDTFSQLMRGVVRTGELELGAALIHGPPGMTTVDP